jgi:hypothetical protein
MKLSCWRSCSSSMSPTICSSTSSMVTSPATPPYSSITTAMWLRCWRNSRSSTFRRLLSGMNVGRAQQLRDVDAARAVREQLRQHVLGHHDAEHVVAALADHRVARVPRIDHATHDLVRSIVCVQAHHLRARDHHVAHLQVRDLERALHDAVGLGVDHVVLLRRSLRGCRAGPCACAGRRRTACVDFREPGPFVVVFVVRTAIVTHGRSACSCSFGRDRGISGWRGCAPRAPPCTAASRVRSWS